MSSAFEAPDLSSSYMSMKSMESLPAAEPATGESAAMDASLAKVEEERKDSIQREQETVI